MKGLGDIIVAILGILLLCVFFLALKDFKIETKFTKSQADTDAEFRQQAQDTFGKTSLPPRTNSISHNA